MKMLKLICAAVLVCTSVNAMWNGIDLKEELKNREKLWEIKKVRDRVCGLNSPETNTLKVEIQTLKNQIHEIEYTQDTFTKACQIANKAENDSEDGILFEGLCVEWFRVIYSKYNDDDLEKDPKALLEVLEHEIEDEEAGMEEISYDTYEGQQLFLLERYAMIVKNAIAAESVAPDHVDVSKDPIQEEEFIEEQILEEPVPVKEYSQEPKCSSRTRWKLCEDKTWCYFPVNAGGCNYNNDYYQVHPEDAFWYKYTSEKEEYFYCVIYEHGSSIVSETVKVVDMPTLPGGWEWKVWAENQIAFIPARDLDKAQWALPTEPVSRV